MPLYQSTASVMLVDDSTKNTETLALGKNLAASYAEVMKSRKMANYVIDALDIDYDSVDLMNEISVSSSSTTGVITATVTDKDPENAARIANKLVEIFQDEIKETYDYATMSVVDVAEPARTPYNVSYVKDMIIYFVVGFVLALGVVFLVFYS